jgi:hypothetical protein
MSWQKLTEEGFWLRFSNAQGRMSYTAICKALQAERMATDHCTTERARVKYGDDLSSKFEYRKGSEHIVRQKESAIARQLRILEKED